MNLINNKGEITRLMVEDGPYKFDLETTHGKKTYTVEFHYYKNKETNEVDKSKLTGVRLY